MSAPDNKIEGLGKRIKDLREKQGYRQQDFADLVHIGRSSVAAYETGLSSPTYANLIKIADALNVSTDYLLGYDIDKYLDLSGIDDENIKSIYELYNVFTASA